MYNGKIATIKKVKIARGGSVCPCCNDHVFLLGEDACEVTLPRIDRGRKICSKCATNKIFFHDSNKSACGSSENTADHKIYITVDKENIADCWYFTDKGHFQSYRINTNGSVTLMEEFENSHCIAKLARKAIENDYKFTVEGIGTFTDYIAYDRAVKTVTAIRR